MTVEELETCCQLVVSTRFMKTLFVGFRFRCTDCGKVWIVIEHNGQKGLEEE